MSNKLEIMIAESGLEKTKGQALLDNFGNFFEIADEWEKKAKMIVVTKADQKTDMDMARVGRLFLREKRIALEKKRKELKEQSLREGKAIDGIANVLKAVIVPIEEYLEQQERFVEIQEEKKREAMRIEMEKKEEEERLENERLDLLQRGRILKAMAYRDFWTTDNYDFRNMSETNFESVMSDLEKRKAEHDKEQERIRAENERLQKEAEEKERKAKAEREAHEKAMAEERAKAEAERKKQEEALRKEREETERKRKEAEAKAKAEQERIRTESEAKAEAERKEKERLAKLLESQIECPKCHHKFQINERS